MSALYRSEAGEQCVREMYRALLDRWPIPHREHRVSTEWGETFVVESGDPHAPSVVLLHGSGGNSAMWLADVAQWAGDAHLFAIDLIGDPGFSASRRPTLASGDYTRWLGEVLDRLGLDSVVLVGFSLGGWLAVDWSSRNPRRVAALVLLSPCGIGRQRVSFLWRILPLALLGGWGRRRALAITAGSIGVPDDDTPERAVLRKAYHACLETIQDVLYRRMDRIPRIEDAALQRLAMPVLALLGAEDVILDSIDSKRRLEQEVPSAEALVLPATGHAIHGRAMQVRRFLAGLPGRSAITK
jgi:pimeloyl-ACP methyl ester carboxylesterase